MSSIGASSRASAPAWSLRGQAVPIASAKLWYWFEVTEAVVKALECYPIEILEAKAEQGRRFVTIRAEPDNDRDRVAKQIGMYPRARPHSSVCSRKTPATQRESGASSLSPSLGASRFDDVSAKFVEPRDHAGRSGYQFEIDHELPPRGPYFLRAERDTGTEKVISRRLRNIKALDSRIDLVEILGNPWRMRRSSRETLDEKDRSDAAFRDLDWPKQEALLGLWSTLPTYFVVGPPGVGKTKLATETVRRRFQTDRSARILVSAQGHDALDHLQTKITETLDADGLNEVIVVRTTTPDRRPTSEEEAHLIGHDYLDALSRSEAVKHARGACATALRRSRPSPNRSRPTKTQEGATNDPASMRYRAWCECRT